MNADPTGIENARVIAMADAAAPATPETHIRAVTGEVDRLVELINIASSAMAVAESERDAARQRAEAAEARVKGLEAALRDVQQASGMGTYAAGIELVQRVARLALAASPPANDPK